MKQLFLSAWAWVVAHPEATLAALYALLNAINAAIPVERRKASLLLRVLDRICIATQRGAINASSWPLAGRSIAKEVAGAVIAERETQAPPPPSEPGYAEQWVLGVVALASVVALALSGCAAGQTPVLSPIAPRVVSDPLYGTCVEVGGKLTVGEVAIAQLSRTCLLMDASSSQPDASAPEPEPAVIPDKTDAGSAE